jgi:hypothetical protein
MRPFTPNTFAWLARSLLLVTAAHGVHGCSSDEAAQPESAKDMLPAAGADAQPVIPVADGCDAIDLPAPGDGRGVQFAIDLELAPGQERQVCKLVKLDHALNLHTSLGAFTHGSHHGLLALTSYHGAFPTENVRGEPVSDPTATLECESTGDLWNAPGVVAFGRPAGGTASQLGAEGVLPEDTAIKLAAGDVMVMNFHMINLTDKPMRACYKQNLNGIPDEQVKTEAGTMFYYNPFITVPAGSRSSATMACPVSEDVTLAAQVSHMHKRGVGYTARLLDGDPLAGGQEVQVLYDGPEWDEPVARINTPALSLHAGQWIEWTCDYMNPERRDVAQGAQTMDEMCMFIGTYWPRSLRMDNCLVSNDDDAPSARRNLGTGAMNGSQMVECLQASPMLYSGGGPDDSAGRYQSQRCVTEACPRASGRLGEISAGTVDPASLGCD